MAPLWTPIPHNQHTCVSVCLCVSLCVSVSLCVLYANQKHKQCVRKTWPALVCLSCLPTYAVAAYFAEKAQRRRYISGPSSCRVRVEYGSTLTLITLMTPTNP